LIKLIESLENKGKKLPNRTSAQLVDYTPMKKELGLL